ncbi:MAG: pyruvate ferredoxin oxidoreductase [Clostridiales bacterium]|nr:pyruvate ferredoxin oxidoreductase [Clostridiales bacterium]
MGVEVFPSFPITPSTEIPEYFSKYIADGKILSNLILVESEHSAMSAAIGSALSNARTATATSSNGLAYMWEMLYIASSMRAPIIMELVCRSISGPLNIHNDHSDAMGMKDTGWIMLFSKNNQDVYDNTIIGTMIAENSNVLLPIAICQDGFITSHSIENIEILEDDEVTKLVGKYNNNVNLLDKENPVTVGPLDLPTHLFEHKRLQVEALANAKKVFKEASEKYEKISGRKINMIDTYMVEDAETVIIAIGSTAETIEEVVDRRRKNGEKVGVIAIRMFRPFPEEEIISALKNVKNIAVMDKVMDYSLNGGPLYKEIISAIYDIREKNKDRDKDKDKNIIVSNYIYGIGGRDIGVDDIEGIFDDILDNSNNEKIRYVGLK